MPLSVSLCVSVCVCVSLSFPPTRAPFVSNRRVGWRLELACLSYLGSRRWFLACDFFYARPLSTSFEGPAKSRRNSRRYSDTNTTQHKTHTTRHDTTQCAQQQKKKISSLSRRLSLSLSSLRVHSLARAVTQQQQQRLLLFRAVAPAAAQG